MPPPRPTVTPRAPRCISDRLPYQVQERLVDKEHKKYLLKLGTNGADRSHTYINIVVGARGSNTRHTPEHVRVSRARRRAGCVGVGRPGASGIREGNRLPVQPGAEAAGLRAQRGVLERAQEQSQTGHETAAGRTGGRRQCDFRIERCEDRQTREEVGRRRARATEARLQFRKRDGSREISLSSSGAI